MFVSFLFRFLILNIILNSYIASALATKQTPPFFKLFFISKGSVDDSFINEIDAFSNDANLSLKVFPYEKNHSGLIISQLSVDNNSNKKGTGRSSSSRITGNIQDKLAPLHQNSQQSLNQSKKKVIKKPLNVTQKSHIRPLASTIYIAPINRR